MKGAQLRAPELAPPNLQRRSEDPALRDERQPPPGGPPKTPLKGARVDIDGLNLALEEGTGVATYGRNLATSLSDLGCSVGILYGSAAGGRDDLLAEISFFDPPDEFPKRKMRLARDAAAVMGASLGVRARRIRLSGAVITEDFSARVSGFDRILNVRSLFKTANTYFDVFGRTLNVTVPDPPALMHWTYPVPITVKGALNIYTVHDLVPLRLPHTTLDHKRRYLRLVRILAEQADHLVTVSESSRQDIMDLLGVPPTRVTNTYQSIDMEGWGSEASMEAVRAEVSGVFGLTPGEYLLFFGAIEPKKNLGRLIQAYLAANLSTPLVIVGRRAWKSARELRLLGYEASQRPGQPLVRRTGREVAAAQRVLEIDYAPRRLLGSLIRGAKAVMFPSLYEGFGLPVLEAMSLGAPVLTSLTSSLPEVAGEAALMVDPYDVTAISAAIVRLDRDADLRAQLSMRGPAQAAKFSASAYKQRLVEVYSGLGLGGSSARASSE